MAFAQELYPKHNEDNLLNNMMVDLFQPLKGKNNENNIFLLPTYIGNLQTIQISFRKY